MLDKQNTSCYSEFQGDSWDNKCSEVMVMEMQTDTSSGIKKRMIVLLCQALESVSISLSG